MRTTLLMSITGLLLVSAQVQAADQQPASPQQVTSSEKPLKSAKEITSYAVGVDLARNFKRLAMDTDLTSVILGMQEETDGKKLKLSEEELTRTLQRYNNDIKSKQQQLRQQTADKNKKDGAAFLAANKKKDGVVSLPSGLQYKVLKAGTGAKPTEADAVTCRYRGTLMDGTLFDNSDTMGMPVTFFVKDSTIEGWKEALKLMPAGSKWQIFVPSELGFGEKGAGRDVGPNATLIYEIELVVVNPQPAAPKKKD